jgi:hypothetical protein
MKTSTPTVRYHDLPQHEKDQLKKLGYYPLFADRDTPQEAYDYAMDIAKNAREEAHIVTAVHVLLNTLARARLATELKTYVATDFIGHNPVGVSAVVKAHNALLAGTNA